MPTKRPHYCNQEDNINHLTESNNKLSVIITGNGDPEKGLCRQVALIGERQGKVINKLEEIHGVLAEYHNVSERTRNAFELYKQENESYDQGIKDKDVRDKIAFELKLTKKRDKRQLIFSIIMAVLTLTAVCYSIFKGNQDKDEVVKQVNINSEKIDNQGVPFVVDKRGEMLILPDSSQIKYFPNDTAFMIKKVKN